MNRITRLVFLSALALASQPVLAQSTLRVTSTRIGNFDYHSFNNGVSGTTSRIGNFDYHSFNNGVSGTTSRIGNFDYHSFNNGVSGTTSRIGNFGYHSFNNGVSGTTTRIGDTTFTTLPYRPVFNNLSPMPCRRR